MHLATNSFSPLIDRFGRQINYLRISVTDRCDLRCNYCIPVGFTDYEEPKEWLTFTEIERVVKAFSSLGVESFRITGGEPLLRKNLPKLISQLSILEGVRDISLSTNGTQLTKYAKKLKDAGLNRINVSMDSTNAERFHEICGRNALGQALDGLQAAKKVGLGPIKINAVFMPDTTLEEVEALVEYCKQEKFVLRLIEVMPVGDTGRQVGQSNINNIKKHLQSKFNLVNSIEKGPGPAKYLASSDSLLKIGFITPMSQHFCESCNRVRMSVDGILYLCLGQNDNFDLKPYLRNEVSDDELLNAIREAILLKPEKHEFNERPEKIIRIMARTGG